MVRLEAAHTLGVLEMYPRAAETVVKRLSDLDPTVRAHAVTSLVCSAEGRIKLHQ